MPTREEIWTALQDPALQRLVFSCGPTAVGPAGYRNIADSVRAERIHIRVLPQNSSASAYYYHCQIGDVRADTFLFAANFHLTDLSARALLVHEATHALQDHWARDMDRQTAEAAAFLAQAYYFDLCGGSFTEYSLERRRRHPISDEARQAGDDMLETLEELVKYLREGPHKRIQGERLERLRASIAAHPAYAAHARDNIDFDGFARRG